MTTDRVGTIVEMGKITTEHDTDAPLEDRLIEIRSEISALLRERVKGGERVGVVIETPTTQKAGKAYKNQNPARAAIYGAVVGMMIATIHGYGGTSFRNYR